MSGPSKPAFPGSAPWSLAGVMCHQGFNHTTIADLFPCGRLVLIKSSVAVYMGVFMKMRAQG